MENQNPKPCLETDTIALEVERFSSLSSEMISLLENLKREINRSALELQDVQAAVDAGKKEIEALCEIERETSSLEQQIEDLRRQKESLGRSVADEQKAWEEAKSNRVFEEREYEENLKIRRKQEEEEYRLALESERAVSRQMLDEELDAMRRKNAEIKAAEEEDLLKRETALKKKERELALLIQELEKFLSGLAGRVGTAAQPGAESGFGREKPVFFGVSDETRGGFNPGNALMWEEAGEKPIF